MDYSNYDKKARELMCSWPIIIMFLFFFFPIGIYLIILKQTLHRRNIFTIGRKTLASGIALLLIGFGMYIPGLYVDEAAVKDVEYAEALFISKYLSRIAICVGIVVIIISLFQFFKSKKYRQYISLVVNRDIHNFDEIASKMNLNKKTVIKDLKYMIRKEYLEDYDIAEDENRIFNIKEEKSRKKQEEAKKEKYTRVVTCPNCHANNKLEEKIGKCRYCNSYIE